MLTDVIFLNFSNYSDIIRVCKGREVESRREDLRGGDGYVTQNLHRKHHRSRLKFVDGKGLVGIKNKLFLLRHVLVF